MVGEGGGDHGDGTPVGSAGFDDVVGDLADDAWGVDTAECYRKPRGLGAGYRDGMMRRVRVFERR